MTFTEDAITDLKQFITATVSQQRALQSAELDKKFNALDNKLTRQVDELDTKVDNLSAYIAEALNATNEATHKQLNNYERRITKLEKIAA